MTMFADLLASAFNRRPRLASPQADNRSMAQLTADLVGTRGEISGIVLGQQVLDRYASCNDDEKVAFFRHLADDLDVDRGAVRAAIESYCARRSKTSYRTFLAAAEPPRQELIRRLNQVPGATRALVRMRADLLRIGRNDDALMALDLDFRHLFASWFNRGFLVLRPINWESPAHILEKIIAYEAVHAIDSWDALRRRLQPDDRRCFAFFHPAMPDEPLIFVEVALTRGIPGSVQRLLDDAAEALDPETADTAVFYSISNCQAGLAGISFGQSLIKQVAADLSGDLPGLRTFVTLSPVPGFVKWLAGEDIPYRQGDGPSLRKLAALYLTTAKRPDGLPLDPVARFHLANGAQLHAVHANADTSANGRRQSEGVMVNYLYDLGRISQNHEAFAADRRVVCSHEVRSLASEAASDLTKETIE
jgi:malonyl-CoA decarboxylase